MDVRQEKEVADAFVLQVAVAEASRQGAGSSHVLDNAGGISKMFNDLKIEAGPKVETRAFCRARSAIVESSDSELEMKP